MTAVVGIFNAGAAVFLGLTFKDSPTRINDNAPDIIKEEARKPA